MHFENVLPRCIVVLAFCAATVTCLKKKNQFYCEKSSPCTCVTADMTDDIDLHDIKILSLNISTGLVLNYQPCPSDQKSAAVELVYAADTTTNTTNTTIPVAYYADVQFKIDDAVILTYKNSSNEFDVILSCDSSATNGKERLTDFYNNTSNHCSIVLKTSKVCNLNLKDAYENSNSFSWTSFFSIILIVAFIYFVCGSIINACYFDEIGVNMIPNHKFWISLYSNTKEKLCGTSMMASAYESI